MSSQSPLDEVLKGQPLEVDIASIEDQLRELWKDAVQQETPDEESAKPVARASVLNLVAYVHDEQEAEKVSAAIGDLTVENPCRAIVAIALPEAPVSKIDAWISAHCHRPSPTSKVVCCEQISLRASGSAVRELTPTAVPFLLSDLPVFLWWQGKRLFESEFLQSFSGVCDRLILDSKEFESPQTDFPRLQSYLEDYRRHLAVSDVAWHRLMQWRELTAQFFDAPVLRSHLEHIESVVVEFNPRTSTLVNVPPQAYLLVGWLASRMQWSLHGASVMDASQCFKMRTKEDGRAVTILIRPTEARSELSGHLVSFELNTSKEWGISFRIAKGDSSQFAQTEIAFAGMPAYRRAVPLRIYNEVELIARQLGIFGHDAVYEEAIAMAAAMVGALN